MKNSIFIIGMAIIVIGGCEKETNNDIEDEPNIGKLECNYTSFKYYKNESIPLGEMSGDYILFGIDSSNSDDVIRNYIKSKDYFDQDYYFNISKYREFLIVKLTRTCDCQEVAWIINEAQQSSIIDYVHYTIQTENCRNMTGQIMGNLCVLSYSNLFYVSVKDTNNLTDLYNAVQETNTSIVLQNIYRRNSFILATNKNSTGDALQMANYFFETGLFEASEPDIVRLAVQ